MKLTTSSSNNSLDQDVKGELFDLIEKDRKVYVLKKVIIRM
jgi:hypothetical protein